MPKRKKTSKAQPRLTGKDEIALLKAQLARTLADHDNLQKRVEKDRENIRKQASLNLILSLLPVIDMLDAVNSHSNDEGLKLALKELEKVLDQEELVSIIPSVGDDFDEELHEAVEAVEGNDKGKIAELILKGWKLENMVIRHAKVKVTN